MRTVRRVACGGLMVAVLVGVGGCQQPYYAVKDVTTGREYFPTGGRALRYNANGAVLFTDAKTGADVTLQSSEVWTIDEAEYRRAVGLPPAAAKK